MMNNNWLYSSKFKRKRIKFLCKLAFSGGTPKTNHYDYWNNGTIKWLASGEIQNKVVQNFTDLITNKGLRNSSTRLFPKNTLLLAMTGATCGNVGISSLEIACANQSVYSYILNDNTHPKFYYYALLAMRDEILSKQNGGAQAGINGKVCKNLIVPDISLAKQKQIADFLDKKVLLVDKLIDIKKQEIEVLIKQKKDFVTRSIKEAIDSSPLTDIKYFSTTNGRIGWQGLTTAEYKQEGPYLITGTDFNEDGSINYNTCVHITFKRYKEASKIQVRNGDVLITKDGTVGKVAIIDNLPCETSLNSGVLLIRPDTKKCLSRYLYYYLKSDYFWDWFKINSKEAATIVHLYQQQFNNFPVYLPPLSIQGRIVSNLDYKYKKLEKLLLIKNLHLNELYNYKKSIIYEYVSGKKEVSHEFN